MLNPPLYTQFLLASPNLKSYICAFAYIYIHMYGFEIIFSTLSHFRDKMRMSAYVTLMIQNTNHVVASYSNPKSASEPKYSITWIYWTLICFFLHVHGGYVQHYHWSLLAMWFFSSWWCVGGKASMSGMWIKAGEFQLGRDSVQLWHTYHPCFPASQMPHRFISHVRHFVLHCSLRWGFMLILAWFS